MALLFMGDGPLASPWYPQVMAWTHLGTLGFLAMVMIGALYQMVPVVAGAPVPGVRLAYVVHAFLLIGLAALAIGFFGQASSSISAETAASAMRAAIHSLIAASALFVVPVAYAVARAPIQDQTVRGMWLALTGFTIGAAFGVVLANGHAGSGFPLQRPLLLKVHFNLELIVWVGSLITAVSWQVVPMFYLTPSVSTRAKRRQLALIWISVVALFATAFKNPPIPHVVLYAAAPGALVVWLIQPLQTLRLIQKRNRPRADGSLLFWRSGLVVALLLIPLGLLAHFSIDQQWAMLWGWWAIWGWAGMIIHGMLTRIVPFLVWFHRMSPHVGLRPVPSMRGLLAQNQIKLGWGLHMASLLFGSLAILMSQGPAPADQPLAHANAMMVTGLTGVLLAATGVVLLVSLIHVLRQQPPPDPAASA